MAKTRIRHIAKKSADSIDPVQNKKNQKFGNKRIEYSEFGKEKIEKSKIQNQRKLPKAT
jgi:hypothetical protein